MRRTLALIGVVLFAVSWFVPVYKGQDTLGSIGDAIGKLGEKDVGSGPPGWQACRMAWEILTDGSQDDWKAKVCGATCLTNLMMLAAVTFVARAKSSAVMGMALLACAGLDLSWVYLTDADFRGMLSTGYWLWTGSFAVVGFGLLRSQD
jgi:hypothetical protein